MDELRAAVKRTQEKLNDFGGDLQDVKHSQRAMARDMQGLARDVQVLARDVQAGMNKLAGGMDKLAGRTDKMGGSFEGFREHFNEVAEMLVQHDTDQLRRVVGVERRLDEHEEQVNQRLDSIERRLPRENPE